MGTALVGFDRRVGAKSGEVGYRRPVAAVRSPALDIAGSILFTRCCGTSLGASAAGPPVNAREEV